jgi:3-hydroxyisobutyrate dehydrogenase
MNQSPSANEEAVGLSGIGAVGYIGMGIMGAAMTGNLLKAGQRTYVWNRTATRCEPLIAAGAELCDSPADMAGRKPDVIFINVTDTPDVEEIIFGERGIAAQASPGLIIVDHSTISPTATRQFAARLEPHNIALVDAPVSGGDVGARNGTLSIMCGGQREAFDRVRPLLGIVGKQVTYLGPSGSGQACKACNQILVAGNLVATCEALALAKQSGLNLKEMIDVVSGGAGGSWQLANLGPKIATGDYAPGFMIDLILKDLAIVMNTAREHKLPLANTALAEANFRAASAAGSGASGTQAVAQVMEQMGRFQFADAASDIGE